MYTLRMGERNISDQKWKLTISKLKPPHLSYILDETMPFVLDKSKFKMGYTIKGICCGINVILIYHMFKIRIINIQ